MNNLNDFLARKRMLEEVESPVNGKLTVVWDLAWKTHIMGGGLTQSGGIARAVWKTSLKQVLSIKKQVSSVLILGLGGGGFIPDIKKHWPEAKITGVDIDPVIINLGKKYLGLDKAEIDIHIRDAYKYITNLRINESTNLDLICVDVYVGDKFPKKFESEKFLKAIKKLLSKNGVAIFNRLYYGEKRAEAMHFGKALEKIFNKVEPIYPEANIMFICSN